MNTNVRRGRIAWFSVVDSMGLIELSDPWHGLNTVTFVDHVLKGVPPKSGTMVAVDIAGGRKAPVVQRVSIINNEGDQ